MQFENTDNYTPSIEDAIAKHPLIIEPDVLVADVVELMNQARSSSCLLPDIQAEIASASIPVSESRSSCVLVMQDSQLVGMLTERDIVKLTARGADFNSLEVAEVMTQPVITLPLSDFKDIFAALFLFRRYRIRHLPIIDDQGQLVGVVSPEKIRQVLRPANLLKLRRVGEVMAKNVVSAPLTTSLLELAQLMAENRVSCVVITQENLEHELSNHKPIGIVTERDIVQFQSLRLDQFNTEAHSIMSTPLFLLDPDDSLWTAHQEMQKRKVRRLVVSWDWGQEIGIVTETSILRIFDPMEMYGVVETLQKTVQQLKGSQATVKDDIEPLTAGLQSSHLPTSAIATAPNHSSQNLPTEVNEAIAQIRLCISDVLQDNNMSIDQRNQQLTLALEQLDQVSKLLISPNNWNNVSLRIAQDQDTKFKM